MTLSKTLKFSYVKTASEGIKMITLQEFLNNWGNETRGLVKL